MGQRTLVAAVAAVGAGALATYAPTLAERTSSSPAFAPCSPPAPRAPLASLAAEKTLIRAVARRYQATPPADRAPLDKAYADAMTEAARAFPKDDTIQVLFAESLMDLSPWDYWEAGGSKPKNRTAELVDALERVLERNPTHPDKALPAARVLARQIPGAGHIVHMPSHIYYRIGLYTEGAAIEPGRHRRRRKILPHRRQRSGLQGLLLSA